MDTFVDLFIELDYDDQVPIMYMEITSKNWLYQGDNFHVHSLILTELSLENLLSYFLDKFLPGVVFEQAPTK